MGNGSLVVPGDLISQKPIRMKEVYVEDGKSYANVMGIWEAEKERFVPLEAIYSPFIGDTIIGIVEEERMIGYSVNIGSAYKGLILSRGLRTRFSPGDIVFAEIMDVTEVKDILLARPRSLSGGTTVMVSPAKISRIIGKRSSMIEMISKLTMCEIFVGKNGVIWLKGDKAPKATEAILKIEREAHTSGLTDRIERFLSTR